MTETLSQALDHARVLVCAGTGGVGKTTISAALALCGARRGRRVLVLTNDPARRLADALGLAGLSDTPVEIDRESWAPSKEAPSSGALFAMMLDPKPTFDRLVTRLSHDPQARARILENRMYRQLSEALAGSAEYAAMERVLEAVESSDYDLVVVDTPPSSHALDFLSTPRRLRRFLDGRFVAALLRPAMSAGRFGARIFGDSLQRMLGLIERIGGVVIYDVTNPKKPVAVSRLPASNCCSARRHASSSSAGPAPARSRVPWSFWMPSAISAWASTPSS